ncbi:Calx-beta domain-containing protein [Catelliglobosispora koreensis]|uniref:Calx-beta domain-containing protein n=1 Tax=Catelliglobosispora koreensis TaxID=129052 RepID=UPI000374E09F|nr:Calx-beta domain-containing protein [Catelliglobosispora koreensis]
MTTRAKQRKRWVIGRILLPAILVPLAVFASGAPSAAVEDACRAREVTVTEASRAEGDTFGLRLAFQITANGCAAGSLSYRTVPGTPGPASATTDDYVTTTSTLSWQINEAALKTVYVEIRSDVDIESDEALVLELFNLSGLSARDTSATGWIRNDDGGNYTIDSEPDCLGQLGQVCEAVVIMSPPSVKGVTLTFETFDGTGTSVAEYHPVIAGQVTFPAGTTVAKVKVLLRTDRDFGVSRYFGIRISQPSAGVITKAVTKAVIPAS